MYNLLKFHIFQVQLSFGQIHPPSPQKKNSHFAKDYWFQQKDNPNTPMSPITRDLKIN